MSELLLELYSEEIPSLIQTKYLDLIKSSILEKFKEEKLHYSEVEGFVGPCRLTIYIKNLQYQNSTIEVKGPKVDSHEKAIEGFCKSHDLWRWLCLFACYSQLYQLVIQSHFG